MEPSNQKQKILLVLVLLVVLALALWLLLPLIKNSSSDVPSTQEVADNSLSPVPGFPADIPIEKANLFETFKISNPETGVTQYTVGYRSSVAAVAKWNEYSSYMEESGLTISPKDTDSTKGILYGMGSDKSLLAIVVPEGGKTLVQLSFFEK